MVYIDRTSPWNRVDLAPAGMVAADDTDDEHTQCHDWLVYAASAYRGQSYLYWAQLHALAEFVDIALGNLYDAVQAGADSNDLFDPYTVTVAEAATLFAVGQRQARALVSQAVAASERLPKTARLLREGVIDPDMFAAVVHRTDIVDDTAALTAVDTDLVDALAAAGHISAKRAEHIADRIVGRHDPDAVRRRAEKAAKRKNVTSRDYDDGLGGLFVTADAEETRLCMTAVDALADGVCPHDPRTLGQRRSAAATARLRGQAFTCECHDESACTASLSGQQISDRQARIVIHAICQKSTLDGDDDHDGFLDGHGPITADHTRNLATRPDATVRDLDLDDFIDPVVPAECPALIEFTAQPANPYRPTTTLDTVTRGLFPSTPLRTGPQICPASGGPTCLCNIGPKCKMHHLLKTHLGATDPHTGWIDDQWADDDGTLWTSTTIHGITVETAAANQWLFTQLADLRCLHQAQAQAPPTPPAQDYSEHPDQRPCGGGLKAATEYKHTWRRNERARLRAERRRIAAHDDPPPF